MKFKNVTEVALADTLLMRVIKPGEVFEINDEEKAKRIALNDAYEEVKEPKSKSKGKIKGGK